MRNFLFNKYFDKLLFALSIMILAGLLIRMGSNRVSSAPNSTNLTFSQWWENDSDREIFLDLIKEFEGLNDGIMVTLNTIPYEDLRVELLNAGEAAFPGDIIALDLLWVPELPALEICEAPLFSFVNVLYYNVELLKDAGFSRPPKTRSEFLACARTLKSRSGNRQGAGFALSFELGDNSSRGIYDDVFPWIWAAGAELVQDGKPALTSRPVVESLSFLAALKSEGLIDDGLFYADAGKKLEDFLSGKTAFIIAPSGYIGFVRERMGEETFGVTSVPIPDNYARGTFFGSAEWTIGINPASAAKEEARLFADFLADKTFTISEKIGALPENGVSPAWDPLHSKVSEIAIAGESASDLSGLPWTELEKSFREELKMLFEGKASPAETAAAIQRKWEAVISSADYSR